MRESNTIANITGHLETEVHDTAIFPYIFQYSNSFRSYFKFKNLKDTFLVKELDICRAAGNNYLCNDISYVEQYLFNLSAHLFQS